ncbi:MAG: PilZ domain-containing protein [Thermodesulfovibrionales bacterium]
MKMTRSFRRYSVFESAESIAHTDEGFINVDTVVVDISRGGFNIKSDTYLPIGTSVLTMLPFIDTNGAEDIAVLTGKVSWSGWNEFFYSIGVTLKDEIITEYNQGLLNYFFRNGMQC